MVGITGQSQLMQFKLFVNYQVKPIKTLIKNGLFFSGNPDEKASKQDILIDETGRIAEIGSCNSIPTEGLKIIDAEGKWVMPGFVDSQTHYDAEVLASPGLKESARHGVTTIILGSCSVSAVFNNPEDTADSFTRVEAIPREVMLPLLEKEMQFCKARPIWSLE